MSPRQNGRIAGRANAGRIAARACVFALALAAASGALAQAWPAKPVRMIANFPAGGAVDVIARLLATPLAETLGQPFTVENRAGANGNIGAEAVARSAPDGYTILVAAGSTVVSNPHLYPKLSYDPVKDLTPVAAGARISVFLVVRPSLPAQNFGEFLALVRASPGKYTYGSPGSGSTPHLAGEMLARAVNASYVHIPYRGAAPVIQDLIGERIDFTFDPGPALPQVRAGKLRLLGVGSPHKPAQLPDAPTLDELGVRGFDADSWFGVFVPAGTPADIVQRLNREINRVLETPLSRERIGAIGGTIVTMSPAEFAQRLAVDRERYGRVIRDGGVRLD
jgi:tripartite-type tricarboxylate transporter receptor subunit TctC